MQNRSLKIASFNINGVLNPVKREKILSKLKKDKIQIAFLQETHLSDSEHAKLYQIASAQQNSYDLASIIHLRRAVSGPSINIWLI
jgi:exonuclease III